MWRNISLGAVVLGFSMGGPGPGAQAAGTTSSVMMLSPGTRTADVLGNVMNGRWVSDFRPAQVSGGVYQGLTLTGQPRHVTFARARNGDVPCTSSVIADLRTGGPARSFEVLTSATHRLQPRRVSFLPLSSRLYASVVKAELRRRGLVDPKVNVTRLVRADLDGNGSDEVIIEAYRFAGSSDGQPRSAKGTKGDYSLLLLRWVNRGKVSTEVLGEFVTPRQDTDDERSLPRLYRLAGVADLNGDGRMEILGHDSYYEGSGFSVTEWKAGQAPAIRLSAGCGA